MSEVEFEEMFKTFSQIIGIAIFGLFITYYALIFRQYKIAVEKHQQLTELFNNPNVRVASGTQATQVLETIKQDQEKSAMI